MGSLPSGDVVQGPTRQRHPGQQHQSRQDHKAQ